MIHWNPGIIFHQRRDHVDDFDDDNDGLPDNEDDDDDGDGILDREVGERQLSSDDDKTVFDDILDKYYLL